MKIPSAIEAERLLEEAQGLNPGPWVPHSRNVAQAAQIIASRHPRLDPQAAYVLGLLHDIGRREGRTHIRHLVDGYSFLQNLGFDDAARVCLTHSFPIPDLNAYMGEHDCSPQQLKFIEHFIATNELTEYDMLVQLCDGIAPPSGFCLLEKRIVDVATRYGVNDQTVLNWQARFRTKALFEGAIGCSIYQLLPGIIEGTFGISLHGE
jgi:HD superfamily phosphohydrolase YqeK